MSVITSGRHMASLAVKRLTNHTWPISHYIMPLAINLSEADTDRQTDTHIPMCKQKQFQETRHGRPATMLP